MLPSLGTGLRREGRDGHLQGGGTPLSLENVGGQQGARTPDSGHSGAKAGGRGSRSCKRPEKRSAWLEQGSRRYGHLFFLLRLVQDPMTNSDYHLWVGRYLCLACPHSLPLAPEGNLLPLVHKVQFPIL